MLKSISKFLLFSLTLLFCALWTQGHSNNLDVSKDTLLVGIAGSEPFVFSEDEKGIALEIWKDVADKNSWNFKYVSFENVDDALEELDKGKLDIVVGPISITSQRLEHMRFSHPYYNSSISIISRVENQSIWQTIKPLFSPKLLMAILIFLTILGVVGTMFWLAERKASPEQFPKEPLRGIGNGMWLAIVTMSTTGYGDKAPVTLLGRILSGTWMIISIIFATSMVAGIASTLTLFLLGSTSISNIEQLSESKAATISGSPSELFLKKSNINAVGVDNLEDAIAKLKNKEVDAVVYDRPQLLYYLKNNNNEDLFLSKAEYYKQGYGFAFPKKSPLIFDVNGALLELTENQETERIIYYYIQKDE